MAKQRSRPSGTVLSEVRMLGGSLPIGATSHGELCPFCRGGTSSERSFSVTRMDPVRLGYCCHRASCGAHGFIGGTPSSSEVVLVPKKRLGEGLYTDEVQGLGDGWISRLRDLYGIGEREATTRFGWGEEVDSGRLVVYIRDAGGKRRGVHTRALGRAYPKSRDYRESEPWVGWFRGGTRAAKSPIILVEDVFSAAKCALARYDSGSLMGSHLSLDQFKEAQTVANGRSIVLALDRDATSKAIDLVSQYSFMSGGNLIPLLLSKDLKYENIETIKTMVESILPDSVAESTEECDWAEGTAIVPPAVQS